ncbi:MAG: efflux RND transporter periplasmic adaptor subunit [Myxococcota bacterium]
MLLGAVVALGLGACDPEPLDIDISEHEAPKAPEAPPTEAKADPGSMVGVLVPESEVVLVASGFARLQRLDLEVGDAVKEGEVVAEMDVRGDKNELASTTAAWKASRAELDRLALELEQARATRSDVEQLESFVSRAELREQRFAEKLAAARKRSAGASLRQQRSRMDEASARIAEAELRAPFGGVISRRYVDPGATLALGEPVVQIISESRLVRFAVPEENDGVLALGAKVRVRFVDENIELPGEVTTIAPEIEAGARLIVAEARLTLDDAQREVLRVGKVGRVTFE